MNIQMQVKREIAEFEKIQITEEIIEENIERVEKGEALLIPLAVLNGVFKREYNKRYGHCVDMAPSVDHYTKRRRREIKKICPICRKEFKITSCSYLRVFCSKECKRVYYDESWRKLMNEKRRLLRRITDEPTSRTIGMAFRGVFGKCQ